MATWKKVVVSGSAVTQLDFTDSTILSGSIENNLPSGVVSSSAQTKANLPSGTVSASVQVDGASITTNTISLGGVSVALGGTDATPAFDLSDSTSYPGDSSLTTLGTVTSGDVSAILPAGTISSSAQVVASTYGNGQTLTLNSSSNSTRITNLENGAASAPSGTISSSATGTAQGTIALNGVDVNVKDMQITDTPHFVGVEIGNATDTTITRVSAGLIAVEGNNLLRADNDSIVSASAQIDGASITTNTVGFGGVSVALGGTDATPAFDLSDATAYPGDSSLTTLGTVTSGDVSAILPAGTISSSAQIASTLPAGVVSGSVQVVLQDADKTGFTGAASITTLGTVTSGDISAILPAGTISSSGAGTNQGQFKLNGVDVTVKDLLTTNSPEFTNLTVSGDLEVAGTASFKNSTNLNVADQYISMNSGSTGAGLDSGGIVVLQDGAAGELFGWADASSDQRWGVLTNFNPSSTGDFSPTAYMSAVLKPAAANTPTTIAAINAVYNKEGNLYTSTADDSIWIYS